MKVGLAELVIVSLMAGGIAIVVERGRPRDPPAPAAAVQPEPAKVPEVLPKPQPVAPPDEPVDEPPEIALEPAIPAPTREDSLDADAIKRGVAGVQDELDRCGPRYPDACGNVRLRVKVAPDGHVTAVDIVETDSNRLGKCAAAAMKGASFDATEQGSLFSYPLNFGCP